MQINGAGLSGISLRYFLEDLSAGNLKEFAHRWSDWVEFYAPARRPAGLAVITMDDVDWCASVRTGWSIFRNVARRLRRPLVMVLSLPSNVTVKPPAINPVSPHHVQELDGVVSCRLLPLPQEAVEQLATDLLGITPGLEILNICGHARGIPGRLLPILNGLLEAGIVCGPDGAAVPSPHQLLPLEIRGLAGERLTGLSDGTRRILDIAAVIGRSFDLEALSQVLGQTSLSLLPAIREAQEAEVLVKDASRSEFSDLLIWQTVRESVPGPIQTAILRDVGHQILLSGGADAFGSDCLLRAAWGGDRSAAASLPEAVTRHAGTDIRSALTFATAVLQLPLLDEKSYVQMLCVQAGGLSFEGRMTEAATCLKDGLKRPLSQESAQTLHTMLMCVHICSGDAASVLLEAQQIANDQDGPSGAPNGIALLQKFFDSWDTIFAMPWAGTGEAVGAVGSLSTRLLSGFRSWYDGRVTEALETFRSVNDFCAVPIKSGRLHESISRATRIQCLVSMRRFDEAQAELRTLTTWIDADGRPNWHSLSEALRALLALERGDPETAKAAATAALALAHRHGTGALSPLAHAVLAVVALRRTDMKAAIEHAALCTPLGAIPPNPAVAPAALWALLMVTEANDGPQASVELAEELLAAGMSRSSMLLHAPYAAPWLVRTALAAHRRDFAVQVVLAAERLAKDNTDCPLLTVTARHSRGLLEGDADALRSAAEHHEDTWSVAQAQEDLGQTAEEWQTAIPDLEAAAETYIRAGASREAARVRHRLREHGVRRRHWNYAERSLTGWTALTETERAIARLVAVGMTNRETAQQMSISPHTVNFHLRNIYRKLNISSRVKLATMINQ
ncbi:LuxR C-terminal-related transcriptional regulator [Streptomyces sp. NPDC047042]|uniref:helix-turn-helix transcriptional regulator n=1 Tax=Streptomyces sp. NPDC047042 TaxID=3154807 RepID=UPI0033C13038